jgi:single-strand DNA-binding protein
MNRTTLVGRLVDDLQTSELPTGSTVTEGRLAVDGAGDRKPDGSGYETGYFNIRSFGPGGVAAAQHLQKGDPLAIDGMLRHSQWEKDGQRRQAYSIVGDLQFLPRPANRDGRGQELDVDQAQDIGSEQTEQAPAVIGNATGADPVIGHTAAFAPPAHAAASAVQAGSVLTEAAIGIGR